MGHQHAEWQNDTTILNMFAQAKTTARRPYHHFVEKGIDAGRRPELVGGGLIRSAGGWKMAKTLLKGQDRVKGDERILGDSDFVQSVLERCNETYTRRQRPVAQGVDLKSLSHGVADYFDLSCDQLFTPGRYPAVVQARSALCFLAVKGTGFNGHRTGQADGVDPACDQYIHKTG